MLYQKRPFLVVSETEAELDSNRSTLGYEQKT